MIRYYIFIVSVYSIGCNNSDYPNWDDDGVWECQNNESCVADQDFECIPKSCLTDTDIDKAKRNSIEGYSYISPDIENCSRERNGDEYDTNSVNGVCVKMCGDKPCNFEVNPGWDEPYDIFGTHCEFNVNCAGNNYAMCIPVHCFRDINVNAITANEQCNNDCDIYGCKYSSYNIAQCVEYRHQDYNHIIYGDGKCFEMCGDVPCDIAVNAGWTADYHSFPNFSCE